MAVRSRVDYNLSKLMGMYMNMDKTIGKDFEAGLANLKSSVAKPC